MRNFLLGCAVLFVAQGGLEARDWTSSDGKKIVADFVELDGEVVVLKMRGKEYRVPLAKLSEEDQEFAKSQGAVAEEPEKAGSLFGEELKPGGTVLATGLLDEDVIKALSGNKLKPTQMKIKLSLPADFDPGKPQKVFWAVGGINNEGERLKGNIGTFEGRGRTPESKGWIVISADTEHGNPRESTVAECKGDKEFHLQVIEEMTKVWPGFKTWKHACGGHSSGAKGTFFRIAQLLKADANVVGGYFSGCNQSMAALAQEETGVRKSAFKGVKGYQSTGDKDNLVDENHIESVGDEMKSAGFREIRSKTFPGGHTTSPEQQAEALDWFLEGE
ncbi:hypothetical protein [Haloferula sp.]|uniref:hypothetical protein n=1 Tax=Haloferula sp. TaxID=2497595 RepID=UPI003C72659C